MSQPVRYSAACDYLDVSVREINRVVGEGGGNPRASALVHLISVGRPQWNTADGQRPTQAEEAVMPEEPGVFTPYTFQVERTYRGSVAAESITAFLEFGRIGEDETSGCYMTSRERAPAAPGASYVAFFGGELVTALNEGPLMMPVIYGMFDVRGGRVIGYAGDREPLPG